MPEKELAEPWLGLMERLDSDVADVRYWAVSEAGGRAAAGQELPRAVQDKLVELLGNTSDDVRADSCWALGQSGATWAVADIEKRVRDVQETVGVKARAVEALTELQVSGSVKLILPLLQSTEADLQMAVVQAMGVFKVGEAVPDLIVLMRSENGWIADNAVDALEAIGGPEAEAAVAEFREEIADG